MFKQYSFGKKYVYHFMRKDALLKKKAELLRTSTSYPFKKLSPKENELLSISEGFLLGSSFETYKTDPGFLTGVKRGIKASAIEKKRK